MCATLSAPVFELRLALSTIQNSEKPAHRLGIAIRADCDSLFFANEVAGSFGIVQSFCPNRRLT
jgi:hypothetical protein